MATLDMNRDPGWLLKRTQRGELVRASVLETVAALFRGNGVGVLVALLYFNAADWQKGLLAAVLAVGLMLGPLAVNIVARLQINVSRAIAFITCLAIPGLIVAATARELPVYMLGILTSIPLLGAMPPLVTAIWRQNADCSVRGRMFGQVNAAAAIVVLVASAYVMTQMRADIESFRPIFLVLAGFLVVGAVGALYTPSRPLEKSRHLNPLKKLSLLTRDKLFGYMCIMQNCIGFANLATIPMRAEFAGSASRGMGYNAGTVIMLTVVIPALTRLIAIPVWGHLFDKINYMVLRLAINVVFAASFILTFRASFPLQIVGSALFGIGMGGGNVAWNLWVTKFAPSESTADYMSVHTFLTGARGLLAPQLSYAALAVVSIQMVGYVGFGLTILAIAMLIPVIPHGRRRRAELAKAG